MWIHDKIWQIRSSDDKELNELCSRLNLCKIAGKVLMNRGIDSIEKAETFLDSELHSLYDPFLLKDMDKAVERIQKAIRDGENIWIYGDYDVDGITSIAVLKTFFRNIGMQVNHYIPNRLEEGYGMNKDGIQHIHHQGGTLIISVDCGITSFSEVEFAKNLGIDVIVTDHHECQDRIPDALAVINPKREDCPYPYKMLAGVGIAFKVVQALTPKTIFSNVINQYVDITAFGTVADIAPLDGENRVIVKNGLKFLKNTQNIGLQALVDICGLTNRDISAGHIGFVLAPRINAVGRLGNPSLGVDLLMSQDLDEARKIAGMLDEENKQRQAIEARIFHEAEVMIEKDQHYAEEKVLVLASENWHSGVIGIVASKLVEKYYKPIIMIAVEGEVGKGSARSIEGFNLFETMSQCKHLLEKFGGHEQAAGLTIKHSMISAFREAINEVANRILKDEDLIPRIKVDCEIEAKDIHFKVLEDLERLEPYGLANPQPKFIYRNLIVDEIKAVGNEEKHLKMIVHDEGRIMDGIGFQLGHLKKAISANDMIDMVCAVERNSFRGVDTMQLNIRDIRGHDLKCIQENDFANKYFESLYDMLACEQRHSVDIDGELPRYVNGHIKNRSDHIRKRYEVKNGSTAVIVNSWNGFFEIITSFSDHNYAKELKEIIRYGYEESDHFQQFCVIVCPQVEKIDFAKYTDVILYDLCFDSETFIHIKENSKNFESLIKSGDCEHNRELLQHIVPSRENLADVYRLLKNSSKGEIISADIDINFAMFLFSLDILSAVNLIHYQWVHDKIIFQFNNAPEKKIDITANERYQEIQNLKTQFSALIKTIQTTEC